MRPTESQSRIVGKRIEPFSGNKSKSIYDPVHIDELVHNVNALMNMQMVDGQVIVSDSRVLLIPKKQPANSLRSLLTPYLYGSQGPDYLACYNTHDGKTPSSPDIVYVAKPPDLRQVAMEHIAIAGAADITYTYPNYDWFYQGRDVYDSTDPNNPTLVAQQVIYPQYRPGGVFNNVQTYPSVIYAQPAETFAFVPDGNGDPTSVKIKLIDTNAAGRVWMFFKFTDPRY